MFTRSVLKTLVLNTICTVCDSQTVYYIWLLCVKYGMHAYAGPACICRMHAPSMLIPPSQYARAYAGCTPRGRAYGHRKTTFMWGMIFINTLIVL